MKTGFIDKPLNMTDSHPRYPDDFQFVQLLLSGDTDAWNRFYKEFRTKLDIYINQRYPSIFGDIETEEICDGVMKRLTENDYKTLNSYRGECTFSTYLTKTTDWEIKDWLRKHSEELFREPIEDAIESKSNEFDNAPLTLEKEGNLPEPIKSLSDDLRWAFLLRYYDYFGFPLEEIRLLASKKGVPIGSITKKIIKFLEPEGEDLLSVQREKQKAFQLRLQKLCVEIRNLTKREQKLLDEVEKNSLYYEPRDKEQSKKLDIIKERHIKLEKRKKALLNKSTGFVITTSYKFIAEILGEDNISTIRSRVLMAKKQLARRLLDRDE